jgi:hypothetical protein
MPTGNLDAEVTVRETPRLRDFISRLEPLVARVRAAPEGWRKEVAEGFLRQLKWRVDHLHLFQCSGSRPELLLDIHPEMVEYAERTIWQLEQLTATRN